MDFHFSGSYKIFFKLKIQLDFLGGVKFHISHSSHKENSFSPFFRKIRTLQKSFKLWTL